MLGLARESKPKRAGVHDASVVTPANRQSGLGNQAVQRMLRTLSARPGGPGGQTLVQRQAAPSVTAGPFDNLPADLRGVLEVSFAADEFGCRGGADAAQCFNKMDASARAVLTSLYRRLSGFTLWPHVRWVGGVWTTGVGGAHFTTHDGTAFFADLLADPRFCIDIPAGALLHPGSTSVREISTGDGLHLSLEAGNKVSAHIDAISPAVGRDATKRCRYDPVAAAAHIGREVVPLGIPGLQVFPEPRPNFGVPERGQPPQDFIRYEIRF
jgi:hypothetical protein